MGVTLDDGQRAALGAEETDGFDDTSDKARQQVKALAEVKGKEVFDRRSRITFIVLDLEILVSLMIEGWAFESWKLLVFGVHDGGDICSAVFGRKNGRYRD